MFMFIWSIITFSVIGGSYEQTIEPNQHEVYAEVGSNVLLSCNYSSADTLLWYKQSPGSAPQYLLLIPHYSGTENRDDSLDSRLSGKLNKEKTRVDLEISSAEETDSAMYYCALKQGMGFGKLTFGKAINLIVEPNGTPARPTLSILTPHHKIENDDQPEVCLATGFFPRIENMNLTLGNNVTVPRKTTKAALSSTRTYFFAGFSKENIKRCEMDGVVKKRVDGGFPDVSNDKTTATTASDNCEHERLNNATATNYTDYTKMNFTSLVVYGLRVLFAKAVAFNVLFTVKALVF